MQANAAAADGDDNMRQQLMLQCSSVLTRDGIEEDDA